MPTLKETSSKHTFMCILMLWILSQSMMTPYLKTLGISTWRCWWLYKCCAWVWPILVLAGISVLLWLLSTWPHSMFPLTGVWVFPYRHREAWLCVRWGGGRGVRCIWGASGRGAIQSGGRSKFLESGAHLENCESLWQSIGLQSWLGELCVCLYKLGNIQEMLAFWVCNCLSIVAQGP